MKPAMKRGRPTSSKAEAPAMKAHLRQPQRMRKSGGGRKAPLRFLYELVKQWFENKRMNGRLVLPADLFERLRLCADKYVEKAKALQEDRPLKPVDAARLRVCEEKKKALSEPAAYTRKWFERELMRYCDAHLRQPQRIVPLSLEQERMRCYYSWQSFDEVMWYALGNDPAWLAEHVAEPETWMKNLPETVILMSDQIPFWVKCGVRKALYMGSENKKKSVSKRHEVMQKKWQQTDPTALDGEAEISEAQKPEQSRQYGKSEDSRYRVTLEVTQVLRGYFGEHATEPTACQAMPVMILPGAYARLSNISESGTWIRDESFVIKGKMMKHKAGMCCGNIMNQWRVLRSTGTPEARALLKRVRVMQQPAGFVDGVMRSG